MDLLHPQPPAVAVIDPRFCQGCGPVLLPAPCRPSAFGKGIVPWNQPGVPAAEPACSCAPTMPRGGLPWRGPTLSRRTGPLGQPLPGRFHRKTPCALRHTVFLV